MIDESVPNMKFIKIHGLGEHSHPAEWFEAFLPQDKTKH